MKRRFLLRHPEGFADAQHRSFVAGCRIWRATIEATIASWDDLSFGRMGVPRPDYQFGAPELSADRTLASLPLDGELGPVVQRALEPEVPHALYHDLPLWFRIDLSIARVEGDDAPEYVPLIDPERARVLKESPLFKKR